MTSLGAFLTLRSANNGDVTAVPLWVNDAHLNNLKFKAWFTKHLPVVESYNQYRIWNEWNNLLWYTDEILDYIEGIRTVTDFTGFKDQQRRTIPFWVSLISDLIDKRATDLASLKANFEVTPPSENITEQTRTAARVVKPILTHIKNFNNLDLLFDENERANACYGWSFLGIEWNDKIGDLKPKEEKKKKKDDDTPPELNFEGEVEIKQLYPWWILPFPALKAFDSPIAIQIYEILHVEDARKKYKNNKIVPDNRTNLFSFSSPFGDDILPEQVVIYRTICRPNQFMPEGAVIYSTHDGTVIKKFVKKYPYSHGGFPWEMHSDLNVLGRAFPYSIMNKLKPLQWTYNLLGGMIKKAIFLTAHPKWMVTRGACNINSLANAITVVQHKAGQQPTLARYDVVGADTTNFRANVKDEAQKLAGSFGLSNGDIPPNTRSGIQISRLQNIEKMNRSYQMGKRNDFMRRVLLKAASVAGDYYPGTSPEHLVRILGKTLSESIGVLANTKISAQYVVKIQNATGFSDDLAGRLDEVAFARKELPGLMTPQQEADIIGVRSSEKFYDITTAALRMAEGENEAFSDGKDVAPPIKEHDHIQHWQTHVIDMQTPQHAMLPDKIKKKKLEHLGIHEMMMEEIADSPMGMAFAQRLLTLERFPLVYSIDMDKYKIQQEQQAEQQAQQVADEAGKVAQTEAHVAGQEAEAAKMATQQ